MKLLGRLLLQNFVENYADARSHIESWEAEVEEAEWSTPHELKRRYHKATIMKNLNVVFNICGNKYRLWVKVNYQNRLVLIKKIGTHKEYDKWDIT